MTWTSMISKNPNSAAGKLYKHLTSDAEESRLGPKMLHFGQLFGQIFWSTYCNFRKISKNFGRLKSVIKS